MSFQYIKFKTTMKRIDFGEVIYRFHSPKNWLKIIVLIFLIFLNESCIESKDHNRLSSSSDTKQSGRLPRPSWIGKEPLVIVGNWDAMPIFQRRRGGSPVWQENDYHQEHTDVMVKKWKDMGVTMAIIHFFKGFGLDAEKDHMENSKKLAALCKKNGIRVGVYIGSTLCYETFLHEKPEAAKWIVPDYLGEPVFYGNQTYRKRVYFSLPGYKEYIKKVLNIAIKEMKVDLIHFDNTSNQAQPAMFFHPVAIEDFRAYLKQKYTPELLEKRLGFSDASYIEPPRYNQALRTIDDPLFQEWTDFRCQQLNNYYAEMEGYIRKLDPNVAVEANPHGLYGLNTQWDQSLDFPKILSHTDYFWTEGEDTKLKADGTLISKIRTFKMAGTLKNRVFTYAYNKLELAECMAYNRQVLGMVAGSETTYKLSQNQKNYIKFYQQNFNYYRDIDNIADVAILHSYATMSFNNDLPYQSTYLFEQALIQEKIPFDIIFDDQLKSLSKYKVLVLANQECLSDKQLELIRTFVKNGGGLVATEHTSLYTEWRQRKPDFGLKDLFLVEAPEWQGQSVRELRLNVPVAHNQIGKGRVVYMPEVKPGIVKPETAPMTSDFWKLPLNWEEVIESVKWAAFNDLSIDVNAPQTVTMELTKKNDNSGLMLHLVNYDTDRDSLVKNIEINLRVPEGKNVKDVRLFSPDGDIDIGINYHTNIDKVNFTIPQLETYNLIVIQLL
tara:strand:+ start:25447 stop:27612 length:2166 start_codon:yes stop_codon:yes gene_type:complete